MTLSIFSVALCVTSLALCVTKRLRTDTEIHRGITEKINSL
jgi:hypothetical protein